MHSPLLCVEVPGVESPEVSGVSGGVVALGLPMGLPMEVSCKTIVGKIMALPNFFYQLIIVHCPGARLRYLPHSCHGASIAVLHRDSHVADIAVLHQDSELLLRILIL